MKKSFRNLFFNEGRNLLATNVKLLNCVEYRIRDDRLHSYGLCFKAGDFRTSSNFDGTGAVSGLRIPFCQKTGIYKFLDFRAPVALPIICVFGYREMTRRLAVFCRAAEILREISKTVSSRGRLSRGYLCRI